MLGQSALTKHSAYFACYQQVSGRDAKANNSNEAGKLYACMWSNRRADTRCGLIYCNTLAKEVDRILFTRASWDRTVGYETNYCLFLSYVQSLVYYGSRETDAVLAS